MRLRIFITLAISILLGGATLWAQGRGRPAGSGGRTNTGAQSPSRNVPATNSFPGRRGYHAQPYGYRFGHRSQFGMGFRFPGYNYRFGYGADYGYSPYVYQPYYGRPYYDTRFYSYPYGCDSRFSSWPYYCQPLYPSGPRAQDVAPYYEGEDYSSDAGGSPGEESSGASQGLAPPAAPAAISREDAHRLDPRDVVLTLDGWERPSSDSAKPLELGSGRHTLGVSARSATVATSPDETPRKK